MTLTCKTHKKCYTRKDSKKCLTPNAWVVFLRTNKNVFTSRGEASETYRKKFKPVLENLIEAGSKDASAKQKKALFHKAVCEYFYAQMKASGKNTAVNKKKVSSGVSKVLEKNSIPKTLKIMGAKHVAAALAAKEQAMKKADASVAAKEKIAEAERRKAKDIIRRAIEAAARARLLKKEAASAKTRTSSSSSTRTTTKAKEAKATASKKKTAFNKAKTKADTLQNSAEKAIKKMKITSQAVTSAKDTADKVAKRKIPRALAALDTSLIISGVGRKRRKRS
ncbi:unnamed protein product [Ectocarpus sp. 4 AP-2014]|uniref:EsV-1-218 n=1 Tax=Ectocarpus siliculosus virus 1 (isolate New Zealand/Kaikoura/1988) TaxID=654926 RepID=Q8QN72_ESV1K|nr:EsV-1-218 [Ectocarpus siliculosus virus 1]AAK14632.1 EsV-1-218 [Ectocarpus siliculosus virus 1]